MGLIAQDKLCDQINEIGHAQPVVVVLDKTPFYGESGGQVGDTGTLVAEGVRFDVINTLRDGGFVLHVGHLRSGVLRQGATVTARVDAERRAGILRADSATHMLHYALRTHLERTLSSRGRRSIATGCVRFPDPAAVARRPAHDRGRSERTGRLGRSGRMDDDADCRTRGKLGAMMLFGEKYPDVVRVVSMGDFSKELCGGTHLTNTGKAGLFKIIGEESVAAGTRRITALTGPAALQKVQDEEAVLAEVAATLKIPISEVPARVAVLAKEVRELKKQPGRGPAGEEVSAEKLLAGAKDISGTKVIVAEVPGGTPPILRQLIDQMRVRGRRRPCCWRATRTTRYC